MRNGSVIDTLKAKVDKITELAESKASNLVYTQVIPRNLNQD